VGDSLTRWRLIAAARGCAFGLALLLAQSACSPSPEELAAASTRIAGDIYATQSAGAPTPTPSRTPTLTPTPSRTPTPTPVPDAVIREGIAGMYDGPGLQYGYLAGLRAGERLRVIGEYQQCVWLKVGAASGLEGWVRNASELVTLNLECPAVPPGTFRPYTGSLVVDRRSPGGKSHLVIDNGGTLDGLIVLTDPAGEPIVACYVRSSSKYTFIGIPDGSYRILVSTGAEWNGDARRFTQDVSYWAFRGKNVFSSSSSRYSVWTVSLHAVEGGTGRIEPLSPAEFPSLVD
jgi:hypothetical protein